MESVKQIDTKALMCIKEHRNKLTFQQYKTLRGQVLAGDGDGALKGLRKLLCKEND